MSAEEALARRQGLGTTHAPVDRARMQSRRGRGANRKQNCERPGPMHNKARRELQSGRQVNVGARRQASVHTCSCRSSASFS